MYIKLREVVNIQFGYYGKPSKEGLVSYLQAKHFNEFGQYVEGGDVFLEEDDKGRNQLLRDGDILFVAKGFRFFAAIYKEEFGKAIASSIFFILRVDESKVIPEYLVSVLNLPKNLLHFQQSASGSSIPSIRKSELEDFAFNLIPIDEQKKVVALQELHFRDIQITETLIKEKQKLFQTTISRIIK